MSRRLTLSILLFLCIAMFTTNTHATLLPRGYWRRPGSSPDSSPDAPDPDTEQPPLPSFPDFGSPDDDDDDDDDDTVDRSPLLPTTTSVPAAPAPSPEIIRLGPSANEGSRNDGQAPVAPTTSSGGTLERNRMALGMTMAGVAAWLYV